MKKLFLLLPILLSVACNADKPEPEPLPALISDADGNVYNTVSIGTQIWLSENLKTTKYNDGSAIPLVTSPSGPHTRTPAYFWYDDTPSNGDTYGALYNWFAVNAGSNSGKNVCPIGWHVPSDAEWTILIDFLGGEGVAGGKLKEEETIHWTSPNDGATDEVGFKALPGGFRNYSGEFVYIGGNGGWWSATEGSAAVAWGRSVNYNSSSVNRYVGLKDLGFSVRCLKD